MTTPAVTGRRLRPWLRPIWDELRPRRHQLTDAWRDSNVRRGVLGTGLIALGSLTPAYLPRNSPWWPLMRAMHLDNTASKIVGTLMVLGGVALLVEAWFRLRPWRERSADAAHAYVHLRHWAVLLIWGAPFLLAPPIFSHDAYSYAAQGWLIHNGINPYEAGPGTLPGAFADQVAWVWRFTPAPYGPLSLQIQHLLVDLFRYDPYVSALAMRIPALAGVVMIGVFLPRLARRMGIDPAGAAWFGVLNPVLVIDFIGGAHNDSLMMGLVVAGLYLAQRLRWAWPLAAVLVGLAAAIKQPALLAACVLPLLHREWRSWEPVEVFITAGRVLASLAVAAATFALVSVATGLGFGWYNAVNVPGLVVTVSPSTVLGQGLQLLFDALEWDRAADLAVRWSRTVGLVVSAVVTVALSVTVARRRPITFLSWSWLVIAFGAPALHSWYVLWGGLLLPLTRPGMKVVRIAVWTTVILLAYAAVNLSWRNGAVALGVAALAGYGWQSHLHDRVTLRRRIARSMAHHPSARTPDQPDKEHDRD
ncbi:polyprenol phosphomannose-dependent alpha 1,6 mannosyltransferase MptB [Aestuariimicrobium ganziense]|uniref:polyprenol phosphomannose-dependent alpha 1,6 mannosyltransferase MptB n=1 Tax=Aestuariimicrobium ganziense TaxID=2773677 RepID=UPI001941C589|nr:polyprenol phosphomannose-dependent alpha 1,6 mannosyltransferase MptB [Aestuariimicrobium ganziense]